MFNDLKTTESTQSTINSLKDCKDCNDLVEFLEAKHGDPKNTEERHGHLNTERQALKSEMDKEAFEQWLKEHQAMLKEFEERYPLPVSKSAEQQAQPSTQRPVSIGLAE